MSIANDQTPLGYFMHGHGPAARLVMHLGWVFGGISAAVCVLIAVLLLAALWRRRPSHDANHIGPEKPGTQWVYIGAGVSVSILFAMTVYMLGVLQRTSHPPSTPALVVTVTGYQWWWKVDYGRFTTANELHIPVGVPVMIHLNTADVIHSFWVPLLAGKTQMIPGQTNHQWIEADTPGIYRGQCTQFCGTQHAHMSLEIVAQTADDFEKWKSEQLKKAVPFAGTTAGQKLFMNVCAGCHTIRGTAAHGLHGPDLTHMRSRRLIAAGLMENTPEHLAEWITQAQELKPGSRMPDFNFAPDDKSALLDYLTTLQ